MIELLFVITNEKYDKNIKPIYDKYSIPFNFTTFGEGTASSSMLEYFGLEEIKKYIYLSLIDNSKRKDILNEIRSKLRLNEPGKGISFTIPLSSSTKYIKTKILNNKEELIMENNKEVENKEIKEKQKKDNNKEYHLIITIITEGYSENVMNAAKKVGAGGGTLIRGRSLDQSNSKRQFLGFSIEPEKDVVLIVANSETKKDIMYAIVKETGLKTKGGGIVFSLPISEAIGLYE